MSFSLSSEPTNRARPSMRSAKRSYGRRWPTRSFSPARQDENFSASQRRSRVGSYFGLNPLPTSPVHAAPESCKERMICGELDPGTTESSIESPTRSNSSMSLRYATEMMSTGDG